MYMYNVAFQIIADFEIRYMYLLLPESYDTLIEPAFFKLVIHVQE